VFERIFANTPELISEAHRLRYQVYCIENAYEDAEKNPEGLERDEYDHHSLHGILRHRGSGTVVGTMRWVMHRAEAEARSFPIYGACSDPRMRSQSFLPIERTAELSRFAISKEFRRLACAERSVPERQAHGVESGEKAHGGNAALNLIAVALQIAFAHGVEYALAAMEPALMRLLSRFSIRFEPLGPLVRYHGWRQPCYAHLPTMMARVEAERPELWDVMTEGGRSWPSSRRDLRSPDNRSRIDALVDADQRHSGALEPSLLAAVA
jgi:N-acyl amino acid synthase of PEP-CTERM/exosortase system